MDDSPKWDNIIKANRSLLDLRLSEVWRYKDLLFLYVKKEVTVQYKQTVLGPLWFFVQPILTTAIFVFVFGNIAGLSTAGLPQPIFYLAGIIIWNFFADCFTATANTFSDNAQIYGKVYFPRLISPLSIVISNGLKFLIQFTLFLLLYLYYILSGVQLEPNWTLFLLPVLVVMMGLLGLGFGLVFSSLTKKYKDLKFLIRFGVQLAMYATPVIYPMSEIPSKYSRYIEANPLSHILEAFKFMFFGNGTVSLLGLIYSFCFMITLLFLGTIIFNRTEQSFIDSV